MELTATLSACRSACVVASSLLETQQTEMWIVLALPEGSQDFFTRLGTLQIGRYGCLRIEMINIVV